MYNHTHIYIDYLDFVFLKDVREEKCTHNCGVEKSLLNNIAQHCCTLYLILTYTVQIFTEITERIKMKPGSSYICITTSQMYLMKW